MKSSEIKSMLDKRYAKIQRYPASFIDFDPIQFPRRYTEVEDIVVSAFCTGFVSFGNRKAILKKAEEIDKMFRDAGGPYMWLREKGFSFPYDDRCFYRMLTNKDFIALVCCLFLTCETAYSYDYMKNADFFKNHSKCKDQYLFGKPNTVNKRLNMILRWLVRKDEIDMGVLGFKPSELLMPVDVHVRDVALFLWPDLPKTVNHNFVVKLTDRLREFDEDDPVKYDLALFSLGEDKTI